MKHLKSILPILAFVLAVGMSFAFTNMNGDPATDYVLINNTFQPIGTEIDCNEGQTPCQVNLDGQTLRVYDAADPNTLKMGSGEIIDL